MVRWHHRLNGHESSPWGHEASDTAQRLNDDSNEDKNPRSSMNAKDNHTSGES